jgi:DNA-binding MarR family transcriptional regulator
MAHPSKRQLVDAVIGEFRTSGAQDDAFEALAADRLAINETDLRCLNIIENAGGLSAGELAARSALSGGAVTGVIDRLETAGLARRVFDAGDRRRVRVEVTPAFRNSAARIWGPMAADWHSTLSKQFTVEELDRIVDFLRTTTQIGRRQLERLRGML